MTTIPRALNSAGGESATLVMMATALVLVVLPRLALIAVGPQFAGDSHAYATVAQNILEHLCVSMSDPLQGDCMPHWGGNQLPGFPAFVAAVWAVAGRSLNSPLIAQSIVMAVCVAYLAHAIMRSGYGRTVAWFTIVVVGLSPTLLGWSRAFFTEGLAIAASLWVLAELIRSHAEGRLRIWHLGIALAVGLFVRHDFIISVIPVCILAAIIHRPTVAFMRLIPVALIVIVPYGAWTVRSVAHGLPILPPFGVAPSGKVVPPGVLKWIGTWLEKESSLSGSVWAIVNQDYARFAPPDVAFVGASSAGDVADLIERMRTYQYRELPPAIDAEFANLARERRAQEPLRQWVGLPARRALNMWLSPFPGLGWPSGLSGIDRNDIQETLSPLSVSGVLDVLNRYPRAVLTKGLVTGYRYLAIFLVALLLAVSMRTENRAFRFVLWLSVSYAVLRTALFSQTILIETRYLVEAMAWLDVALAFGLAHLWSARANRTRKNVPPPVVT